MAAINRNIGRICDEWVQLICIRKTRVLGKMRLIRKKINLEISGHIGNLVEWQVTQGGCSESRSTHGVVEWSDDGGCSACCAVCLCASIREMV